METEAQLVKNRGFSLHPVLMKYDVDPALQNLASENPTDTGSFSFAYPMHTSMRPWVEYGHPLRKNQILTNSHTHFSPPGTWFSAWIKRWHWSNSLLQIERKPTGNEPLFRLYIDPLLNLQAGSTSDTIHGGSFWINTRGIRAYGDIGTKISFETSFIENQALFPGFISGFAETYSVIPGQGRWKRFRTNGYDFAMASGFLSYSPNNQLNFQIGHGKHFIGDGYRSLLLSDNSFNYPYFRFGAVFGGSRQFQYTSIYAVFTNLTGTFAPIPVGTERLFQKKATAFHQFSWKPIRTLEFSIVQGVVWQAADSTNRQQLGFSYFIPVIGLGPAIEGLNGKNNFVLGLTARADVFRTATVYGQLLVDDLGSGLRSKAGIQLGVKYFNAFTLKHLHLQGEYNRVSAFAYQASDPAQSWTHYNQPLAHPLGANFNEWTGSLQYKLGDFFLQGRVSSAMIGVNDSLNRGQNLFLSDSTGITRIGDKTNFTFMDFRVGYMLSYASNLNISAGIMLRKIDGVIAKSDERIFYISLRTSIANVYPDFY